MRLTSFAAPTVNTNIDFWPSVIDMLTSALMVFLLIYFVQFYLSNENLEAAIAQVKRDQFKETFEREFRLEENVSLEAELNSLRITFGESVLFKVKKYQLEQRGRVMLGKLAGVFKSARTATAGQQLYERIQIEGHTDTSYYNDPAYPRDNWELSTARALAVLKFLAVEVPPPVVEKMSANGYGSNKPKEDKSKSRRIEIRIFFSGKEGTETSQQK
jgi:flagellar motor protein MotB